MGPYSDSAGVCSMGPFLVCDVYNGHMLGIYGFQIRVPY